jgi:hypothetical protein
MGIFGSGRSRFGSAVCCAALVICVTCWISASTPADAALRVDYQFQNTLASSLGAPPALTTLGLGTNAFASESVNGSPQTVLTFPAENGVQLMPTTGVIPNDHYTLMVLFRFAQITNRAWQRIVDFENGTSDRGLYSHEGVLELYPYARGTTAQIKANEYLLVVLTRDITGTVTGYIDGIKQFSYDDSSTDAAVIDASNTLRFFRDNETGGPSGESSAGAVARIQLYDTALTANQVASLPRVPPAISRTATANVGHLSFAAQPLDTLSAPQTVVVTNTSQSNLRIQRVQMTGANPNDFLLSSDDCSYITLLVRRSCSIGVRFAPSASKHRSATLSVRSADPLSPLKIKLSGIGGRPFKATCAKTTSKPKHRRHTRTQCATKSKKI